MTDLTPALLGVLGGSAVAALISATTTSRIARATRRDKAAETLWNYHYTLSGFASTAASELQDEQVSMLSSEWQDVKEALRKAYPYAGYLGESVKNELFTQAWIDVNTDPSQEWYEASQARYNQFSRLAAVLEAELQWAFPQRFGDRCRALRRRIENGRLSK